MSEIATTSEAQQTSLEVIDQAVNGLASAYHEDWRKTRLQEDGTFEPREKETKDEAWIAAHGSNMVDIANTSYDDLPNDWQEENRDAAHFMVDFMLQNDGKIELSDPVQRNQAGEAVHSAWLSRENNSWAQGGNLDKPFDQLTGEEQDKDIRQVEIALEVFNKPDESAHTDDQRRDSLMSPEQTVDQIHEIAQTIGRIGLSESRMIRSGINNPNKERVAIEESYGARPKGGLSDTITLRKESDSDGKASGVSIRATKDNQTGSELVGTRDGETLSHQEVRNEAADILWKASRTKKSPDYIVGKHRRNQELTRANKEASESRTQASRERDLKEGIAGDVGFMVAGPLGRAVARHTARGKS